MQLAARKATYRIFGAFALQPIDSYEFGGLARGQTQIGKSPKVGEKNHLKLEVGQIPQFSRSAAIVL